MCEGLRRSALDWCVLDGAGSRCRAFFLEKIYPKMPTGHSDHLKRGAAPKSWMLDRMGGTFAIRPASGPHKKDECIPLGYLVSRFLGYAGNAKELEIILKGKNIKINGRVRTCANFPVGLFDVLSIEKTNEHFRVLYNVAKKFHLHRISSEEATTRVAKVVKKYTNLNIPYVVTHCGTSFRFCDPAIDVDYSVRIDIASGKVVDHIAPGVDRVVFVSRGKTRGRIGVISSMNTQGKEMIYGITDFAGNVFSCTYKNCVLIGESEDSIWMSLTKEKGIRMDELGIANAKLGEMVETEVVEVQ